MTDSNQPERRKSDQLAEYRMNKMEIELEKTNTNLIGIDNKLDILRGDLFERSIFVNINTMQLELQKRDFKIDNLEEQIEEIEKEKDTDVNLRLVKIGIGIALFTGVASSIIGILAILVRT